MADPLCFTCSMPVGSPPRLNHRDNGTVCPTCRDRLLEFLPPPFNTAMESSLDPEFATEMPEIVADESVTRPEERA